MIWDNAQPETIELSSGLENDKCKSTMYGVLTLHNYKGWTNCSLGRSGASCGHLGPGCFIVCYVTWSKIIIPLHQTSYNADMPIEEVQQSTNILASTTSSVLLTTSTILWWRPSRDSIDHLHQVFTRSTDPPIRTNMVITTCGTSSICPLWELVIWRTQIKPSYEVDDARQDVHVKGTSTFPDTIPCCLFREPSQLDKHSGPFPTDGEVFTWRGGAVFGEVTCPALHPTFSTSWKGCPILPSAPTCEEIPRS